MVATRDAQLREGQEGGSEGALDSKVWKSQEMEKMGFPQANTPSQKKLTSSQKRKKREVRKAAKLEERIKADRAREDLEAEQNRMDAQFLTHQAAMEKAEDARLQAEVAAAEAKSKAEIEAKKEAKAASEAQEGLELEETCNREAISGRLDNHGDSSQRMVDQLRSPFLEWNQEREEVSGEAIGLTQYSEQ